MISFRSFNTLSVSAFLMEPTPPSGWWGEVVATFNHSFYVQTADERMICIADRLLDDGPITLRVDIPWPLDIKALGARAGMPLRMEGEDWLLGEDILLRTSGATRWVAPAVIGFASPATVIGRLGALRRCLERDVPEAGLAALARYAEDLGYGRPVFFDRRASHLTRVGVQRLTMLVDGVWALDQHQIDAGVRGLIGLGPGLTPSGDDLLGGFMIGLTAILDSPACGPETHQVGWSPREGLGDSVGELARTILRHAATETTQISCALLSHAVKGVGNDSVHRMLQALLQRDDAPEPSPTALKLTTLGHTSGWDCLAGILVGVHLGFRLRQTQTADGSEADTRLKMAV